MEQAELSIQSDISATKLSLSNAKKVLLKTMTSTTFSSQNVINAQLEVEKYEEGLKRLEQLRADLF